MRNEEFDVDDVKSTLKVHNLGFSAGSDHSFIEFDVPFIIPQVNKHLWIKYRSMKDLNVNDFKEAVKAELETKNIYDPNIDEALEHLNLSLAKVIEAKSPTKNKVVINKKKNFITVEITTLRRARRKAERKSKIDEDLKVFKDLVADVSHIIKKLRKDFYTNKLTNCKNGR